MTRALDARKMQPLTTPMTHPDLKTAAVREQPQLKVRLQVHVMPHMSCQLFVWLLASSSHALPLDADVGTLLHVSVLCNMTCS